MSFYPTSLHLTSFAGAMWHVRSSAGKAAGLGSVAIVGTTGTAALIHFLGVDHPMIRTLLTVLGKLPK